MGENLEHVSAQAEQALSEESIISQKIYGKCRQQDCLRPDFIPTEPGVDSIPITGSKSKETAAITSIGGTNLTVPVTTDNLIVFPPNLVKSGKVVDGSFVVSGIEILTPEQEQNLFASDGYWKVTIKYQFSYKIQLIGYTGNPLVIGLSTDPVGSTPTKDFISAYSEYEKQMVLFGGVGNPNVYMASNLYGKTGPYAYQNAPYVNVQTKATPLVANIGSYINPLNGLAPTPDNIVGVTIGLFSIIQLFRLISMTVQTTENKDLPICEPIVPGDPCSYFNELPFPFDDFDPPTT